MDASTQAAGTDEIEEGDGGAEGDEGERRRRPRGVQVAADALESLTEEWAELHRRVPGATVFLHPSWFAAWLRHFGDASEPVFLAFRREDDLVGVAALDLAGDEARQLGDANVTDYSGLLVAPGQEPAVAGALFDWLAFDMTQTVRLWGLRATDPMLGVLSTGAEGNGWIANDELEALSSRLPLPDTWDGYLLSLSKHERHEVRRKLRHLEEAGTVAFKRVCDDAVPVAMDRFLEFMGTSRADKAAFLTEEMEGFFRDLASTFAPLGCTWLGELTLDGRPIAMLLAFEDEETVSLYNSGYDPEYAPLAAGLLSKLLAIRDAIERGKRVFDLLRGDEAYKTRLGGVPLEVRTLELVRR